MPMYLGIHDVTRIELVAANPANSNSRTFRITTSDFKGNEFKTEVTVYGVTKALDALPRSIDFREFSKEQETA